MLTWLGAALAFSLSMIVFSTIVTAATEAIHRGFGMREAGLRRMLDKLFGEAIRDPGKRAAFVEKLTRNLAAPERRWLPRRFSRRHVGSLHWRELVRRVVENDTADEVLAEKSEEVLEALAVRYERFGVDATTFFQERARSISIALAFAAAFALNVDAVKLFSGFLQDRGLTERVVADSERILAAYQGAPGGSPKPPAAGPTAKLEAAPAAKPAGPPGAEPAARAEPEAAAALDQSLERLRAALQAPSLAGLPVGSNYYPWCASSDVDPRCGPLKALLAEEAGIGELLRSEGMRLGSWLLSVLLAGFLIGLGGPFWFDAYSKLAAIVGGATGQRAAEQAESAAGAPPPLASLRIGSARDLQGRGAGLP